MKVSIIPMPIERQKFDMSAEYIRKRNRLKKQWAYIEIALKRVQLTEQSEKRKLLLKAVTKSDALLFEQLIDDDVTLLECPIPVGYNHFNLFQIIIERSTESFIDRVLTKYTEQVMHSTEGGKILVPIACERGDGAIFQLILKKFPSAPLDGTSNSNQGHTNLLDDEPRHLTKRELEAHDNEMALFSTVRNDRSDLLSILVRFRSFPLASLTRVQKRSLFHLCLLAEHRQVTVDKFNLKWLKHHSLRPCGSLECLRLLIEDVQFNPFDDPSALISPFTIILEPIYLYLIELHHRVSLDRQMKFPARLLRALQELIGKQISLFTYLVTHCCCQPTETDRIRLSECSHYIEEVFHATEQYLFVRRVMANLENLVVKIQPDLQRQCLSLKEICRLNFRQSLRDQRRVLIHIENRLCNLSASHKKYLKCLG